MLFQVMALYNLIFTSKAGNGFMLVKTKIIPFIKAKLKKSDDQTNIDKSRVAANISEYHIITKIN